VQLCQDASKACVGLRVCVFGNASRAVNVLSVEVQDWLTLRKAYDVLYHGQALYKHCTRTGASSWCKLLVQVASSWCK